MKIAVINYIDLPEQCVNIKENLIDVTEFKMHGPLHQLDIHESENITETLNSMIGKYDWAVVIAAGTYFYQQELIVETVKQAQRNNSPLICHIIHKGGYYYFHPQWFAIDLKVWESIGKPSFEDTKGSTFTTTKVKRSAKNFHDDYTPYWISAGSGQETYTIDHGYYGTEVVRKLIESNYMIINVPKEIRNSKFYSYPDSNFSYIEQLIANPSAEVPKDTPIYYFNQQLLHLREFLDIGYYPVNTEQLTEYPLSDKLDCFIGVCGGLKPAYLSGGEKFDKNTTVYLIDISPAALAYQKYLIENWDGNLDNFENVISDFKLKHPQYKSTYFAGIGLNENLKWSFEYNETKIQDFTQRWKKYQKYKFHFVQLDLLDEQAPYTLKQWTDKSKLGTYLWVSNSFCMDWLVFYKTMRVARDLSLKLIDILTQDNQSLIVYENGSDFTKHYPK